MSDADEDVVELLLAKDRQYHVTCGNKSVEERPCRLEGGRAPYCTYCRLFIHPSFHEKVRDEFVDVLGGMM